MPFVFSVTHKENLSSSYSYLLPKPPDHYRRSQTIYTHTHTTTHRKSPNVLHVFFFPQARFVASLFIYELKFSYIKIYIRSHFSLIFMCSMYIPICIFSENFPLRIITNYKIPVYGSELEQCVCLVLFYSRDLFGFVQLYRI